MCRVLLRTTVVALSMAAIVSAADPVPLTVLGKDKYEGHVGGLYADGRNEPWGPHADALRRVSRVQPLDRDGKPDSKGKIVIAGIGASVCRQIFAEMEQQAVGKPGVNSAVIVVDCAVGGQDHSKIADPNGKYWPIAEKALTDKGVTPAQVQVVWHQSDDLRDDRADFPGRPQRVKDQLGEQLRLLKKHFPNVQMCYFSGRHNTTFMAAADARKKHTEPRPYYHGWAVKWLIEDQSAGKGDLAFEGSNKVAPLAAWATYFWTVGDTPRPDGYRLTKADIGDGVHLSEAGRKRVAGELLSFLATDANSKAWFTSGRVAAVPPAASPVAPPASKPAPALAPPKAATANEPAWVVNGKDKLPKLRRLVAPHEEVRVIAKDMQGKQVAEVRDILHRQTDLNKLLGPGEFRLEFLDKDGKPIRLTQEVGEVLRLK